MTDVFDDDHLDLTPEQEAALATRRRMKGLPPAVDVSRLLAPLGAQPLFATESATADATDTAAAVARELADIDPTALPPELRARYVALKARVTRE